MDRTQRQQLLLIGLGIVLVLVIAYMGIPPLGLPALPKVRDDVAKLETERQKLQATVDSAQAQVAGLDKIRKERETLEAQLKEESRRLPSERETPALLRSVETLAGKSGLVIMEVKRRPTRNQELYAEIPLEVGVTGNYQDLLKFADQLAQMERLVTLSEAQVTRRTPGAPGTPDAAPGSVRAQMVAVVFQTLSDAAAPAPPAR